MRRHPADRPLRIWVAGCSTGEETYSLAMLFLEEIAAAKRDIKLQVFASDVDGDAVAFARDGLYPESIAADVSPARLARFFTKEDHGYRVVPELRGLVVFTVQDVLADPPFSRLDLVSCRNLLIYLRPEAQEKVLLLFHFALREGGILFLGGSETVGNLDDRFEPISKTQRIYRHDRPQPAGRGRFSARREWRRARAFGSASAAPGSRAAIARATSRSGLLIEAYAPASVLINRKYECLYYSGPTDRYLRVAAGEPSRDLLAMVREGLRNKLRAAIRQASRGTRARDRHRRAGERRRQLRPGQHRGPAGAERGRGLAAGQLPRRARARASASAGRPVEPTDDASRIAELERELDATRKELQSAIRDLEISNEEQKAINEEAMSVNEEFQSTNEELVTSKEELQSLNEELTALNSQLQETLERQRSTSNDLQNILDSADVATLFLDRDLNIRFFTPAAKSLFRVIATDIGRPLADLTPLAADRDLLADARAVLTSSAPLGREIEAADGAWYIRRILPYRTQDNRIEGVVITFADISEIKAAEREIQAARAYSDSIIDTIRQPLVVLDEELRVVSANRSFYRHVRARAGGGRRPSRSAPSPMTHSGSSGAARLPRAGAGRARSGRGLRDRDRAPAARPTAPAAQCPQDPRRAARRSGRSCWRSTTSPNAGARRRRWRPPSARPSRPISASRASSPPPAMICASRCRRISLLQGLLAKKVKDKAALRLVARLDETVSAMSGMLNTLLDINQLEAGIVRREMVDFPINADA